MKFEINGDWITELHNKEDGTYIIVKIPDERYAALIDVLAASPTPALRD